MVVLGTRPEALKLAPVVECLDQRGARPFVCSTGQHGTLLDQALRTTGLKPDRDLGLMRTNQDLNALTAALISALSVLFKTEQPGRVIVQGDTTTAMSAALAAHQLKLPVSHVEAGLRTSDVGQPWPEEFNRRAIALVADQHFAPTAKAAAALISEGVPPQTVHVTGNTSIDALLAARLQITSNPLACEPVASVLSAARGRRLLLVTCHRRENHGAGLTEIAAAIRALSARDDVYIAVTVHPNPQVQKQIGAALGDLSNISLLPPLDYACFVRLLSASYIVLTDSGGVQEEAPTLGKPVLVLRNVTERIEGIEAGTAKLVGTRAQRIVAETCLLLDNPEVHSRMARAISPYGDGRAAERIATILTGEAASASHETMI